jgi:hypothetical protein
MDFKIVNPNGENVIASNLDSMDYNFLKIVKIEFKNLVQSFLFFKNALSTYETSFFICFTPLIGMK